MSIEMILQDYLARPKLELGDRSLYVGASDVAQCPRKGGLPRQNLFLRICRSDPRLVRGAVVAVDLSSGKFKL